MIRLTRTRDARALAGFTADALQEKLEKLLEYYYEDGANGEVNFKPKCRQIWGKSKAQLKKESAGKCAYCEADTAVVAHGDVEHFRPKSVYWWLAYCYDNYTFSCQICNQKYKSDKFPIQGSRLRPPRLPASLPTNAAKKAKLVASLCPDPVASTDDTVRALLSKENADLLDPYLSDTEACFAWEPIPENEEVLLVPKGRSARARRAVAAAELVLGLNRQELRQLRWHAYFELETIALTLQEGKFTDAKKQVLLQRLRRHAEGNRPFAGMRRYFLRSWGLLAP